MKKLLSSLLILLFLHTPFSANATIPYPTDGTILSHWKLDEGTGNAIDALGALDLTEAGTVGSAVGKFNGCRTSFVSGTNYFGGGLSGSATDYDTNNFVIEIWFKTAAPGGSKWLVEKGNTVTAGYDIWMDAAGDIHFRISSLDELVALNLDDDAWHYLVAAQLGAGADNMRLYIDGSIEDSGAGNDNWTKSLSDFQIGDVFNGSGGWSGELDDVTYWNVIPSSVSALEETIAARWAGGAGATYAAGYDFKQKDFTDKNIKAKGQ